MSRAGGGEAGSREKTCCSFGVEIDRGQVVSLIERGQPLPARARRLFTTVSDHQAAVEIHVLQGGSAPHQTSASSVGRFLLAGIRHGLQGEPRIEVCLEIDADGMVRAAARDMDTGSAQEVAFSQTLPEEEPEVLARRILSLVQRVRDEAAAIPRPEHARLRADVNDLVARSMSAASSRSADELLFCRTALETLLGEMRALRVNRPAVPGDAGHG